MLGERDNQYSYRKQYLGDYVRGKGRMNPSDPSSFTFYMGWLAHHWFAWTTLIFLIDNYYSFECFFWFTFREVYDYSLDQLLPLNVVLLLILLADSVFRVMVTPVLPEEMQEYLSKQDVLRLKIGHYFWWGWTGPLMLVYLVYVISYLVPYQAAQYLHLVYIARLVVLNTYFNSLYRLIHKYNLVSMAYTLFLMIYLILYLSTVFGCIFYVIDQTLIESQYFGDPALNPNLYYQYVSFTYTPMQSLPLAQRFAQAYYFSSGLVTTMAYGDVVGKNYIEVAYVMVLLVLSTIIIAYLFEQFLIMVGDNRFAFDQIVRQYKHLQEMMTSRDVPWPLQVRIRNYIFYVEYYNKFQNPDPVFRQLPHKLQMDMYVEAFGRFFMPLMEPIGYKKVRELCHGLTQITIQPDVAVFRPPPRSQKQLVVTKDQISAQSLYPDIIVRVSGILEQWVEWQPETKDFYLREGAKHYNCFEFFTGLRVRFGLRSKSIVRAVTLSRKHFFEQILAKEPVIKRRVAALKESVLSNDEPRGIIQDDCEICEETDHNVLTCPDAHYAISGSDRAITIGQVLTSKKNQRASRVRRTRNSKKVRQLIHYSVLFGKMNINRQSYEQAEEASSNRPLSATFLSSSIRNILGKVKQDKCQDCNDDSVYDQRLGASRRWALPYNDR